MGTHQYDGDWTESTTIMRPIDNPTYQDVYDLPNGAEVMMFAADQYHCVNLTQEFKDLMRKMLDEQGPDFSEHPDEVLIAQVILWVHPDDMSDKMRANIAELEAHHAFDAENGN